MELYVIKKKMKNIPLYFKNKPYDIRMGISKEITLREKPKDLIKHKIKRKKVK